MAQKAKTLQLNRPNQPRRLGLDSLFSSQLRYHKSIFIIAILVRNIRIRYGHWGCVTNSVYKGLRLSHSVSFGF